MCETPEYFGRFEAEAAEESLYDPLCEFLRMRFPERLKPQHGAIRLVVEKTDQTEAPGGGSWQRPDVAAVSVAQYKYSGRTTVNVHTFEVKTNAGGEDEKSVFQALAYSRFANSAYLVWNRQNCTCGDHKYQRVFNTCEKFGVGLITIHKPSDLRTYTVKLMAERRDVSQDALDDFIESRFSETNRAQILSALAGPGQRMR